MYKKTVSVVIPYSPTHTSESMLKEAKKSVDDQAVRTNTLVIRDNEQNGPAWARNKGLKKADTRYIAFLDADDLWLQDKLHTQLNKMDETGSGLCVEGNNRSDKKFIIDVFLGRLNSLTSSILIDTKQVDVKFDENLERKEDHLFLIEAANQGGVCLCPNLTKIRKHPNGLSAETDIKKGAKSRKEFLDKCCNKIEWLEDYRESYCMHYHYYIGRKWYAKGEYKQAMQSFIYSLRKGFYWKTIPAMFLSVILYISESLKRNK